MLKSMFMLYGDFSLSSSPVRDLENVGLDLREASWGRRRQQPGGRL